MRVIEGNLEGGRERRRQKEHGAGRSSGPGLPSVLGVLVVGPRGQPVPLSGDSSSKVLGWGLFISPSTHQFITCQKKKLLFPFWGKENISIPRKVELSNCGKQLVTYPVDRQTCTHAHACTHVHLHSPLDLPSRIW